MEVSILVAFGHNCLEPDSLHQVKSALLKMAWTAKQRSKERNGKRIGEIPGLGAGGQPIVKQMIPPFMELQIRANLSSKAMTSRRKKFAAAVLTCFYLATACRANTQALYVGTPQCARWRQEPRLRAARARKHGVTAVVAVATCPKPQSRGKSPQADHGHAIPDWHHHLASSPNRHVQGLLSQAGCPPEYRS